ncbi:DUF4136 domain-containing protein [Methylococcus capsulatus]|uniref:Putative lipoprotein n=1 Tax=Methylococcus capsulatus (strain ATCC 33009 / NCIMB 11132 / Bath) TaxID=243233 RepID=Q60BQ9_METCA|nr:DUF4136 domain-containing protein [Methylococcus capsulatus]AAU90443.1 putative lipoprotein [Methylococcus capsulatus str. Bath]UQN11055.1 DUF4136 domain-containing protein [Methylococcus capsulatus]
MDRNTSWRRPSAAGLLVAALLAACATIRVDTGFDKNADFSRYRTYFWLNGPASGDASVDRRIVELVDAALRSKGWRRAAEGKGDAAVDVEVLTEEEERNDTYYDGWVLNQNLGPAQTVVTTFREGTLIVNVLDGRSMRPVWRGVAHEMLSGNPAENEKLAKEAIARMFAAFPPGPAPR